MDAGALLLHHLLGNRAHRCQRVKNCKEIVWKLFVNYLHSEEEFDSRILHSYDNAFAVLKPKEYSMKLVELSKDVCLFNSLNTMQSQDCNIIRPQKQKQC